MAADRNRVRDVFHAALELSPEQRPGFLTDACGGDAELRAEVDRLLASNVATDSIVDPPSPASADAATAFDASSPGTALLPGSTPASDAFDPDAPSPKGMATEDRGPCRATESSAPPDPDATTAAASASSAAHAARAPTGEGIDTVIAGRYTLVDVIGEGGMGSVYLAEQTEPVKRQVALKLIKTGMDSRGVLARFDAERQALALMDHPNIARIYDGGLTPAGQPFFVMELVSGVPLTEYCDTHRLTVKARLELFVAICQAVQHAHQKGIIHRDLKPGNVLVTEVDGRPTPKVIDFGVAKATEVKLTDMSLADVGAIVGTPAYMSPEQADPTSMDIDTRTDVYALGVMLYELLTGSPPIDARQFQRGAILEMLRMVREVDPPRPSTKLSTAEALPHIAANRSIEPARLAKLLHGELDWVVMKALEKDRTRRYETANGFARDIQRYLADEVVEARPPSAGYRFQKLVTRNKGAVLAVAAVAASLLLGTGVAIWQAVLATQARQDALVAKEIAEGRQAEIKAVLDFVEGKVFAAARPKGQAGGQGNKVLLRTAVETALPFVEKSFKNQPAIEARLRLTLGTSFLYLGNASIAAEQFQRARALYTQCRGPDHTDTIRSMSKLATSFTDLGRHADALKLGEETLALTKAKLGPDDAETLLTMNDLAVTYFHLGRHSDAMKLHEETLALRKAKLGPDHRDTLQSMIQMPLTYATYGRHTDALKLYEEALPLMKAKLGLDDVMTLECMNDLAVTFSHLGRHTDALKLNEETLALRKAKLGPMHWDTLTSMGNLAVSFADLGRYADALKLNEETLTLRKAKLGPEHHDTLISMNNLADDYNLAGRYADALKLSAETVTIAKAELGPDHPTTLASMVTLAESLVKLERGAQAVAAIDECVQRAAGNMATGWFMPHLLALRLRHFEKTKDASGCRQTAEMWEKLNRTDADSLYTAGQMRAVTAAVLKAAPGADAIRLAGDEAGQALAWLKRAIAAGYNDVAKMKNDSSLLQLRERDDFLKLIADLEKKLAEEKNQQRP